MVNYICEKCGKNFYRKCNYIDHLNKKKPCREIQQILIKPQEIIFTKEEKKININDKIEDKNKDEDEDEDEDEDFNNNLCCGFCGLICNRKDNLKRHIDKFCKVKKIQEQEKENIFKILLAKEEEEKKQLKENNKKLEENYKESQLNNKNLQKKYKKIEKSNKELLLNNEDLSKQNKKLEDKIAKSNIVIDNYNKQIEELKSINTINNNLIKYEEFSNESDDDNESTNLIIDNNIIMSREADKYINGTQLCKAGNKKINDWYKLENTKQLISVLESEAGIPASQLVDIKKGNISKFEQGVWLHPDLAIQLAQWINPKFALQVSKWIRTLFSKGKVNFKLIRKQEEKINRSTKKIKELESMVLKKQKREIYPESNVIYMLTTEDHKKRNTYISGKATKLTDRLSIYNKTCDHEVVYYKECESEENMNLSEKLILIKLDKYREVLNRDRFILPDGEEVELFVNIINKYV
jgi:hypothetical protein